MNTVRRQRCRLCREEGHNYRTCPRLEIIHRELIDRFKRLIIDNQVSELDDAYNLQTRYMEDYSHIALKALARKHELDINLTKNDYCNIFKRLYTRLAYNEIQSIIGDEVLRDVLLRIILLQEQRNRLRQLTSNWIESDIFQIPISLFTISLESYDEEDVESFVCPICIETITDKKYKIKLNCNHKYCEQCMFIYLTTIKTNIDNNEPLESCTPKCPMCRCVIKNIYGDIDILNDKFKDRLTSYS